MDKQVECKTAGCSGKVLAQGYCSHHYYIERRHHIKNGTDFKVTKIEFCTIDGCSSKNLARGYCSKHYKQLYTYGKIIPNGKKSLGGQLVDKVSNSKCSVPGCTNNNLARGYCNKHYQQLYKYGKIK